MLRVPVTTLLQYELLWHTALSDVAKGVTNDADREQLLAAAKRMSVSLKRHLVPQFDVDDAANDEAAADRQRSTRSPRSAKASATAATTAATTATTTLSKTSATAATTATATTTNVGDAGEDIALALEVAKLERELDAVMQQVARNRRDLPPLLEEQTRKKVRLMYNAHSPTSTTTTTSTAAASQSSTTATATPSIADAPDVEQFATTCAQVAGLLRQLSTDLPSTQAKLEQLNVVLRDHMQSSAIEDLM